MTDSPASAAAGARHRASRRRPAGPAIRRRAAASTWMSRRSPMCSPTPAAGADGRSASSRSPSTRSPCRRRSRRWTASATKTAAPWHSTHSWFLRAPPGSATRKENIPHRPRAAARAKAHGAAVDRAVREAAGLDPEPPEDWSDVLRFVALMTDAAERRDMGVGGAGTPFPPLRRTIGPWRPKPPLSAGSRASGTWPVLLPVAMSTPGAAQPAPRGLPPRRRLRNDRGGRRYRARAPGCCPGLPHLVQVRLVDRHRRHPRGPGRRRLEDHQRLHQP